MSVFDVALEKRFVESTEIALVDVDSTDVLLIHNTQTGAVYRIQAGTLASFINSAISQSDILNALNAPNGVATLGGDGKVPAAQLPAYVDDVLEYSSTAAFPATGEAGKIYVALNTNLTYRWSGSAYVEISASLALGETSSTAYRGDRGKTAYDHSQSTGNPHGTSKADVGLGNVDNTSDANKPVSTAQQTALDTKANKTQPDWIVPTFLNSWVDFGSPYDTAGYYKDEFGVVHLKGMVKSGTAATVFTLPAGYRPGGTRRWASVYNGAFGYVQVDASGNVTSSGSGGAIPLDVVQFKAI